MEIRVKLPKNTSACPSTTRKSRISKPTDGLHRTETSTCKSKVGFEQKDRTSLPRIELGSVPCKAKAFTTELQSSCLMSGEFTHYRICEKLDQDSVRDCLSGEFASGSQRTMCKSPNKTALLMHKGCDSKTQPTNTRVKTRLKMTRVTL